MQIVVLMAAAVLVTGLGLASSMVMVLAFWHKPDAPGLRLGILILVLIAPFLLWRCVGNAWSMLTDYPAYVVPERSSVFTFEATQMNEGSGGWWIYGEDLSNYYWYAEKEPGTYVYISRNDASGCLSFNPLDHTTWCKINSDK